MQHTQVPPVVIVDVPRDPVHTAEVDGPQRLGPVIK